MKSASRKNSSVLVNVIVTTVLSILAAVTLFPFYNVVIVSFSNIEQLSKHSLYLLPYAFDLTAYGHLMKEPRFFNAFLVSAFVTIVGVIINMLLSVMGAYALSKKGLPGRNFILGFILLTMFFSGGLIPYYLVVKSIGLVNNLLVMIFPVGISTIYLIIMKNYFATIPESLEESAKIDGANDLYILWKIILPISKPFIATFALFYAVERWNEWWNALIFINDSSKIPLQIFLRDMLINFNTQLNSTAQAVIDSQANVFQQTTQMAAIVISAIPILCVYPFLQKHFVRGIIVGSVKE